MINNYKVAQGNKMVDDDCIEVDYAKTQEYKDLVALKEQADAIGALVKVFWDQNEDYLERIQPDTMWDEIEIPWSEPDTCSVERRMDSVAMRIGEAISMREAIYKKNIAKRVAEREAAEKEASRKKQLEQILSRFEHNEVHTLSKDEFLLAIESIDRKEWKRRIMEHACSASLDNVLANDTVDPVLALHIYRQSTWRTKR